MRKLSAALAAVVTAAGLASAPAFAQPAPRPGEQVWDRVVAVVGDTSLLYSDVLLELEAMQSQGQPLPSDSAGRAALFNDVLQRRVDDLLVLDAARRAGVSVDVTDVVGAVEEQINQVQSRFGSQAAFEQALQQSGRTLEQYRQTLTQQYMDQTIMQRFATQRAEKMPNPTVTDAEIAAFFERQRERLGTRPATLSFQQAVVTPHASDSAKAAARRTAERVLEELRAGGDFEVLARRYSQDPSASQGGMLGWFREGQMVRPFEQMAYSLRPGETSPIVETEYGYHIIKLEKARGPERQARHILIRPEVTQADIDRARATADSIATAVRGGASLTALAESHGTPSDQRVNRDVPVDRLPPAYATAVGSAAAGSVVGPFELTSPTGTPTFAVVKLTARQEAGPYRLEDVSEQIRTRLQQQKKFEAVLAELRKTTYVAILQ
ncbi:MAG TPA: peptidylprolyl isomerase [Longimicrobium sp.]|nr:peptidylprolyl isomerase [Longimicrobium sp.]